MSKKLFLILTVGLSACCSANGDTIVLQQLLDNNPVTGGWTPTVLGTGTGTAVAGEAWQTSGLDANAMVLYDKVYTESDWAAMQAEGWYAKFVIKVITGLPDPSGSKAGGINGRVHTADGGYSLTLGVNGNDIVVAVNFTTVATITGGNGSYHEYVMQSTATAGQIDLYIDGDLAASGLASMAISGTRTVRWGDAGKDAGTGTANFSEVTVSTGAIPEPTTISLLGLAVAAGLFRRRTLR